MTKRKIIDIGESLLICGDCFEVLPTLDVHADAVISDPPFGITDCDWDKTPPLDQFWEVIECKAKPAANVVLFGCGKFSIDLVNSNYRWYRYDLIWQKNNKCGFANANKMPMRNHESIMVFGQPGFRNTATYNPQKQGSEWQAIKKRILKDKIDSVYTGIRGCTSIDDGTRHPCSVLPFKSDKQQDWHPTQKPLALMEFLVKSYTNEGDLVIDPFMGSGTTGVACAKHGRRFIGIEKNPAFFKTAVERIKVV